MKNRTNALRNGLIFWAGLALAASPCLGESAGEGADVVITKPQRGKPRPLDPGELFSGVEQAQFRDALRHDSFDNLCRGIQLGGDIGTDFGSLVNFKIRTGPSRSLHVLPDEEGTVALIDSIDLRGILGLTKDVFKRGDTTLNLTTDIGLSEGSFVLRPLGTTKSCSAIGQLARIKDFRVVVPLDWKELKQGKIWNEEDMVKRLKGMEVGELWDLPAEVKTGIRVGGAETSGRESASVVFGRGHDGTAEMTVYRLSENKVRFKLRLGYFYVRDTGGQVVYAGPATHIFANTSGWVKKGIDHVVADQIVQYLTFSIGYFVHHDEGEQIVIEFSLDPTKDDEMLALARAMRGDLKLFPIMAKRVPSLGKIDFEKVEKDFREVMALNTGALAEDPSHTVLDASHTDSSRFPFTIPFFWDHSMEKTRAGHDIRNLTEGDGGDVVLFENKEVRNNGYLNLPLRGALSRNTVTRSAPAFAAAQDKVKDPQAVFIKLEGFRNRDANDVRRMADDVNRLNSLIGVHGGAPNPARVTPIDSLLPRREEVLSESDSDGGAASSPQIKYKNGELSLLLVFNARAVASMAAMSAQEVAKSLRNVVDPSDGQMLDWLLDRGTFQADGKISFPAKELNSRRSSDDESESPYQQARGLTGTVEKIVSDLTAVREAKTPQQRAEVLSDVLAGKKKSGRSYERILEVLVQGVADPLDVSMLWHIHVNKGIKGEENVDVYAAFKDRAPNELLDTVAKAKGRTQRPSKFTD